MKIDERIPRIRGELRFYSYILIIIWAATVFGLLSWGVLKTAEATRRMAFHVAEAYFDKDRAFRLWAASHGGVYAPVNDRTPPNPYLENVPERDLITPSGKALTLINPAYMLRQLHEHFSELYGVTGHLTSLKPLRPENRPDDWEKNALEAFEKGASKVTEYTQIDGKPSLRLIKPLVTEKDCLKCHSGYKEGDIRGGVGIALPIDSFLQIQRSEIGIQLVSYGSIFVIGLVGVVFGMRRLEDRELERDRAQEALRASERKYRMLFDKSMDGVFMTSRDGVLIDANQSLLDMFGYAPQEAESMDVRQLYVDSRDRDRLKELLEINGHVKDYQVRYRKKDGKFIDCVLTASVRVGEDGSLFGYQGIIRDITDKKKAEEALKSKAKELERSNADLEQFASVASHDLREPLRNVTSCIQMLEKRYKGQLGSDADRYLHYAVDSAERMSALIDDLLTYSKVGTGEKHIEPSSCEEVVERAIVNLQSAIDLTGAIVTHDELPTVPGDPTQLLQLFQNLIANAVKFHQTEKPPTVHVSVQSNENDWTFSIKDNGIGMESQHMDRIFKIFQRLHTRAEYEGTGVGLAIVKKIVERHGGRIWVESELGVGTTFYFTLPKV